MERTVSAWARHACVYGVEVGPGCPLVDDPERLRAFLGRVSSFFTRDLGYIHVLVGMAALADRVYIGAVLPEVLPWAEMSNPVFEEFIAEALTYAMPDDLSLPIDRYWIRTPEDVTGRARAGMPLHLENHTQKTS